MDSFFWMSGFLLSYTILQKMGSGSLGNWLWVGKAYLHRYLRLTPTVIFVTLFVMFVFPFIGSGPLWWPFTSVIHDNCIK